MNRLGRYIPHQFEDTEEYEQRQARPRRNAIPMERRRYEPQQSTGPLSSISEALGTVTEAIAYNVTNGVNSANRTLRNIFIIVAVGALLLGMLLMRTIDRELLGSHSQSEQPALHSQKP